MNKNFAAPTTLQEAIKLFADPASAHQFFAALRWPDGVKCVACESANVAFYQSRLLFQCRECRRQFTAKLGTVFEDSPIGWEKWLPALWMLSNCKNGISSYELHHAIGVTQKTAWFMLGRIRTAMQSRSFQRFGGEVEVDETFVGGLAKFMHKSRRQRTIKGTGGMNKTSVHPETGCLQARGDKRHVVRGAFGPC